MTHPSTVPPAVELPSGLTARMPGPADVEPLVELLTAHQEAAKGSSGVDRASVAASVTGTGSWTRRQVVVETERGRLAAWASVHDRAAGRTVVEVTLSPDAPSADRLAAALFGWAEVTACEVARQRGVPETQLDASARGDG